MGESFEDLVLNISSLKKDVKYLEGMNDASRAVAQAVRPYVVMREELIRGGFKSDEAFELIRIMATGSLLHQNGYVEEEL